MPFFFFFTFVLFRRPIRWLTWLLSYECPAQIFNLNYDNPPFFERNCVYFISSKIVKNSENEQVFVCSRGELPEQKCIAAFTMFATLLPKIKAVSYVTSWSIVTTLCVKNSLFNSIERNMMIAAHLPFFLF